MKLPSYGDKIAMIQWLAEHAALPVPMQQDKDKRHQASLVMKRFVLTKPTEAEFTEAMRGLVLTPEILYTLTIYAKSGKK